MESDPIDPFDSRNFSLVNQRIIVLQMKAVSYGVDIASDGVEALTTG